MECDSPLTGIGDMKQVGEEELDFRVIHFSSLDLISLLSKGGS
jgi:hypothetical protein